MPRSTPSEHVVEHAAVLQIAARAAADAPYGSYGSLPRGFQSRRLLTDGSYSKGQCSSLMHILRFTGELISLKAVIDVSVPTPPAACIVLTPDVLTDPLCSGKTRDVEYCVIAW